MRDFSLPAYGRLLAALKQNRFEFYRFMDQPFIKQQQAHHVILRHDVDRMPSRALQMAELEASENIISTYFFRTKSVSFNNGIMRKIMSMGHEIGYHYECLSDTRGDMDAAWRLFQQELRKFDNLCEVKSIAMHGRPLLPFDNRDLWNHYDYRNAGVIVEAYRDVPWKRYRYFTDVGGRWDSKENIRDKVPGNKNTYPYVNTTADLIQYLSGNRGSLIISTHPERWPASSAGWLLARSQDYMINHAKKIIKKIYT